MNWIFRMWRLTTWRPYHLGDCPACGTHWIAGHEYDIAAAGGSGANRSKAFGGGSGGSKCYLVGCAGGGAEGMERSAQENSDSNFFCELNSIF